MFIYFGLFSSVTYILFSYTHVIHFFFVFTYFLLSFNSCGVCVSVCGVFFSLLFRLLSLSISIWLFRLMNVRTRICLLSVEFLVFGLCRSLFFRPQSKYTWTHVCVCAFVCALVIVYTTHCVYEWVSKRLSECLLTDSAYNFYFARF